MNLQQQAKAIEQRDRAEQALATGRAADALAPIAAALRIDPGCVATRIVEARARLALHQPLMAIQALDAARLYDSSADARPDVCELRLAALIAAGRDDAAVAVARKLVAACPQDVRVLRLAVAACERAGRADEQINYLEQLVALAPGDLAAGRALARLIAQTNPQRAAGLMGAGSGRDESSQWQSARWLIDAGRYADAESQFRQLLAGHPDDPALLLEAGELANLCGDYCLAAARYLRAIALPGRHRAAAMRALAIASMHAGRFRDAAWWWWKVTRLHEADAQAWASLVVSGLCVDRPFLVELASTRLQMHASDADRGKLLASAWMHATTGEMIRSATQPPPVIADPASPLTWMLERSADVLAQQSAAKPGWADTLYHAAVCRAALGDFFEAREFVQAALDINSNYKAATTLAARLPKVA